MPVFSPEIFFFLSGSSILIFLFYEYLTHGHFFISIFLVAICELCLRGFIRLKARFYAINSGGNWRGAQVVSRGHEYGLL